MKLSRGRAEGDVADALLLSPSMFPCSALHFGYCGELISSTELGVIKGSRGSW